LSDTPRRIKFHTSFSFSLHHSCRGAQLAKKIRSRLASLTLLEIAAGIAVGAVAVPALAADMPTKAPPPIAAPVYNWTGFYVGAHAGYRWANADFNGGAYTFDPPGDPTPLSIPARNEGYRLNGGIVGGHVGYNYQFAPNWLAGVEGDLTWGSADDSFGAALNVQASDGATYRLNYNSEVKLTWQATIRGRLGYVTGAWLFYGTGGVAFARAQWSETALVTGPGGFFAASSASSAKKTLTGFAAGAGAEYMFAQNWMGRVEYLYENFGDFDAPFGFGRIGHVDIDNVHKVRVGISYKFGP
jgi:outer membrane immunogenic protein